jgi:hypothetical protein
MYQPSELWTAATSNIAMVFLRILFPHYSTFALQGCLLLVYNDMTHNPCRPKYDHLNTGIYILTLDIVLLKFFFSLFSFHWCLRKLWSFHMASTSGQNFFLIYTTQDNETIFKFVNLFFCIIDWVL